MAESFSYCFTFVCQEGRLEPESMLLAASLERYLRCEHELVACVPEPAERWGTPCEGTLALFEELGVRVVGIRNRIDENYPHGNKVSCLSVETTADKVVFLDSDILCMREFAHDPRFEKDFNAKPADHLTFGRRPDVWRRVYETAGVPFPEARIRTTVDRKMSLPYLNRLEMLVDQGWNVWLLVRHPLFAITSWKRVPKNFAIAKIDPPDPLLAHIPVEADDADGKRIQVWNHYARRIDALRDRVNIVRYEDLVADVTSEMGRFCAPFGLAIPDDIAPLESANDPSRYGAMDPAFRTAVNQGCELSRFGYDPA